MVTPPNSEASTLPHPTLTAILNEPTAKDINLLRTEIYTNASSVPSTLGGGNHGHLGTVTDAAYYLELSNQLLAFTAPGHPGPQVPPTTALTEKQILNNNRIYDTELRVYTEYNNLMNKLKQQIIAAVPEAFIAELREESIGYANKTPLDLLTHLITTYGTMTDEELEANRSLLASPWNPDEPFARFWVRVKDIRSTATNHGVPITDTQTITLCRTALSAAGVYGNAINQWDTKPPGDKTWATFQQHFKLHEKARIKGLTTAQQAGFHGANYATNYNVGIHVPSPPPTVTCASCNAAQTATTPPTRNSPTTTTNPPDGHATIGYCWSHGATRTAANHTSKTCTNRKEGHKTNATVYDTKGGSFSTNYLFGRSNNNGRARPPPQE